MKKRKAFTLAELLVVVAIIAVLVGIGVPIFSNQLNKTYLAVDKANIRSCYATASCEYVSKDWDGTYKEFTEGSITCSATVTDTVVTIRVVNGAKSNKISSATYFENGIFYNIADE